MTVSKSADGALKTELIVFDDTINLTVFASPSVIDTTNGRESIGNSTEISCHYSGKPLPDIKWLSFDGKIILEDSLKYEISSEERSDSQIISYLKILNLQREDNGTYLCDGENEHGSFVAIMIVEVLDKPSVDLDFVTAVGMSSIYLNWTTKAWNSPIIDYFLKYRKIGSDNWVFYIDEKIPTSASSVVINDLDSNSSYYIELAAKNAIGVSEYNRYHSKVSTLDFNPSFVPKVSIKGLTWNFVSISWTTPENIKQKEHIHQYKLTRKTDESEVDMYQSSSRPPSYLWRHLDPATECGFPSSVVKGTTEDGLSGPPAKVEIYCRYDNISGTSFVDVKWSEPEKKYGKIQFYNVHLNGRADYVDQNGNIIRDDWGPKHKTEDSSIFHTRFDFLPSNTNYSVKSCMMKSTPPRPEILNRFQWFADSNIDGRGVFRLRIPKLSERSGKICCARVIVVKLKRGQTVLQLPHQSALQISTYSTVQNQEGGAYIAEIIGSDNIGQDILVGDGENVVSTNIGSCPSCQTGVRAQLLRESSKANKRFYLLNERSKTPRRLTKRFDKVPETEGLLVEDGFLSEDHNYTAFVEVIVVGDEIGRSGFMSIRRPGESPSVMVSPVNAILVSIPRKLLSIKGVEMDLRRSFRHFCSTWGRGGVGRRDHSQYLIITPETSPPEIKPISKDDLVAAFKERHKDSDYGFQAEFELLPDKFPDRTTLNCEMPINRVKNRAKTLGSVLRVL
ncbi:E3.1.3.48 [Lepeophtheirus salmonis]|uniref:E3.1.3.48 n=1 Tax=Lepeophtheirus salmonis TaxID=72036 RepID=A0A7R8CIG7_LEPSM|nr:E3.1.3.48 [Lepeophtheirus salmonis]CAF2829037.1 E3.1.3.48 [Lepeophtheirus salmonis]